MQRTPRAMSYVATAVLAGVVGATIALAVISANDTPTSHEAERESTPSADDDPASKVEPAPFPSEFPGFRLTSTHDTFVRVFDDGRPQVIYDFPATMNGCSQGKFVVRWRTLDPDVPVEFRPVYGGTGPDNLIPVDGAESKTSEHGYWESLSSCEQPSWSMRDAGSTDSTLTDITVEYQVWTSAP